MQAVIAAMHWAWPKNEVGHQSKQIGISRKRRKVSRMTNQLAPQDSQRAANGLALSYPERREKREWLLGRVATLLSHYWREDDPAHLAAATARDWADVLDGMPQDAISKACLAYLRDEPRRKPTPGAIYALAKTYVPRPALVPRPEDPPRQIERERVTPEKAKQIMDEIGFVPKKFGVWND
jgi:hypothetical protein